MHGLFHIVLLQCFNHIVCCATVLWLDTLRWITFSLFLMDFPIQTAAFSILSALLIVRSCPVRGGSFRQAVQPGGAGHAWMRAQGCCFGAGSAPEPRALWVPAQVHIHHPSFPRFPYSCPRRQLMNTGWMHPRHIP